VNAPRAPGVFLFVGIWSIAQFSHPIPIPGASLFPAREEVGVARFLFVGRTFHAATAI
jgi:hypothetical protein